MRSNAPFARTPVAAAPVSSAPAPAPMPPAPYPPPAPPAPIAPAPAASAAAVSNAIVPVAHVSNAIVQSNTTPIERTPVLDPWVEASEQRNKQRAMQRSKARQEQEALEIAQNLQEEQRNAAEARAAPRYVSVRPPNPPSPATQQVMDNADAATALMTQDLAEGQQVLDTIMGSETAHKKRSKTDSDESDSNLRSFARKNDRDRTKKRG